MECRETDQGRTSPCSTSVPGLFHNTADCWPSVHYSTDQSIAALTHSSSVTSQLTADRLSGCLVDTRTSASLDAVSTWRWTRSPVGPVTPARQWSRCHTGHQQSQFTYNNDSNNNKFQTSCAASCSASPSSTQRIEARRHVVHVFYSLKDTCVRWRILF